MPNVEFAFTISAMNWGTRTGIQLYCNAQQQ
jgi:hypothetical protein